MVHNSYLKSIKQAQSWVLNKWSSQFSNLLYCTPLFLGYYFLYHAFLGHASKYHAWKMSIYFHIQFSHVRLFMTLWTAARQASLSITNSRSLLKLMSIMSVIASNHLILCCPLLLPPSPGYFPVSHFFTSGGQHIEASASASVLPTNIQDWFPLRLTGWISLQSKGLSRMLSSTTVPKHQFFSTQLYLWSSSHIHTWLLGEP